MKKVYLFLAAVVAALSSCVEESTLAPVPQENQVTIKAVAGGTKTTLEGTAVVWEKEDELAVVLKGVESTMVNFNVKGEVNGANATFTGSVDPELQYTSAYAVYPHSAYTVAGGAGKISHTLPETQTGVITSGMNLSSALLNVEQLQAGEAVGTFQNALTLLQVVVPSGVQSVSLTSSDDALVGDLTFNEPNADGVLIRAENGTKRTVTLSTGSELAAKTHSLLVYPGIAHTLTLTMVGTDGAEYTSAVSEIRFNAGEYRTIDLTEIFNVATKELHVVLPAGGTVEVPVVTTGADYQVSLSSGAESWLTYALPTKSFHKETIVFNVAENTSGADRTATVTITCGEKSKTFTIQQKNIFMDFLNDENGDPIQWAETFSIYSTQEFAVAGTNAEKTYENVFTIALSDDYSKGTYKVTNIFKTDEIWLEGPTYSNEGGIYYADYADNKLTIKMEGARKSYFFGSDVVLIYNSTDKTFVLEQPAAFSMNQNSSYNKAGFIGSYTAAVKVEEEPEETPGNTGDLAAFVGTWTETYVNKPYSWSDETVYEGEFTVSIVDGKLYFENMFIYKTYSAVYTANYYGTLSEDGKTITLEDANGSHNQFGPVQYAGGVVLTVDGNTLTVESAFNNYVLNYVATKK